jgi:fatty acid desaturase
MPALASPTGAEFRDDVRRARTLTPEEIKRLTRLDPWRSTLAVAQTYALLAAALFVGVRWWSEPAVVALAVVVIATQQHALFVLAHDAAHYRLYERRWLNDLVGRFTAMIAGISMCCYRVIHRLHHNHLYGPQDPDIPLHGGYPRGRRYLALKLLKDLTGATAPKTYGYFFGAPAQNIDRADPTRPLDDTSPALRRAALRDRWLVAGFHVAAPVAAFAAGYGWTYLVLWALPLLTLIQPILRFRALCEHGAVTDFSSPLTAARTSLPPWWLAWMFPHHVNYHIEHHLYPSIPHYNLPEAHRLLAARGGLEGAEVRGVVETAGLVFAERRAKPA